MPKSQLGGLFIDCQTHDLEQAAHVRGWLA
jgi:hypothetical protein